MEYEHFYHEAPKCITQAYSFDNKLLKITQHNNRNGDQQFGEIGKFDRVNMNLYCHEATNNMHDSKLFIR